MTSDNKDTKIDPLLFIDQELIKQFICPICKYLLNEPTMDMCGCSKLFCKNCLVEYLKSHDNTCIISGNKSTKEPLYIKWVDDLIKLYDIKCKNASRECNWVGKFSKFKEHILICPKEPLPCSFEGCDKIILRENYEEHLQTCNFKTINCKLCGLKLKYNEIEKHDLICPKKEIECPQKCGERFERGKSPEHILVCKMNFIDCPFKVIGCTDKIERNNPEKTNQNFEKHLNLLLDDYINFKNKIINIICLICNKYIYLKDYDFMVLKK